MTPITRIVAWVALLSAPLAAQQSTGIVRGQVTDPSGRLIPGASVTATRGASARTDAQGGYELRNLAPGVYTVQASAKGFAVAEVPAYEVVAGKTQVLNFSLKIATGAERITVNDASKLDVNPESNAGALVLRGKALDALSDDRDALAADLQALAGPAAGPNGGQIYIDGFTGGRLPPKASIQEIRVNQNPFSAQYDRLGYGRVEIITKPGTEDFHGELLFQYGNDVFNSRNPFTPVKAPYERRQWEGEATGPLGKKTTYSGDFEIRRMSADAFINALTLNDSLQVVPVSQAVVTPFSSTEENIKIDRQLAANHSLTASYMYARDNRDNQGIGGFSLAERAYRNRDAEDTFTGSETASFGPRLVNELRGRYSRQRSRQSGNPSQVTIAVPEGFVGGGSPLRLSFSNQDRYEVQNLTSLTHGSHVVRWGVRVRGVALKDQDTQNYTGTFTFTSLDNYRLTLLGLRTGLTPAQIRASGGGASQFSIAGGNPLADLSQVDAGFFAQDDWRILPNLTLSGGLRYEMQTHLGDGWNIAPRLGFGWGLGKGKTPKTVVRGGVGLFYDRVSENIALDALRRDGIHQQQFVATSPDFFPTVPTTAELADSQLPQAIRRVDSGMRAPRLLQTSVSVERQLPKKIVVSTNYVRTFGLHQLRSRNITALSPTATYLYEASGRFHQDQLIASINAKVSSELTISSSYTLGWANSDTDGAGNFPANSYNLRPEYGRAGFDVRHRVQLNGSIGVPWGVRFSPLLVATSGRPFNVTLGRDLNGDTLYTDRPALATDLSRKSVVRTAYGVFDIAPLPDQTIIPRNVGRGPAQFALNLRLTKTITLHEPPDGSKREPYELTFSVSARNLLNHPNFGQPVGNLSSPLFGTSTAIAGSGGGSSAAGVRQLDLQVKFSF